MLNTDSWRYAGKTAGYLPDLICLGKSAGKFRCKKRTSNSRVSALQWRIHTRVPILKRFHLNFILQSVIVAKNKLIFEYENLKFVSKRKAMSVKTITIQKSTSKNEWFIYPAQRTTHMCLKQIIFHIIFAQHNSPLSFRRISFKKNFCTFWKIYEQNRF